MTTYEQVTAHRTGNRRLTFRGRLLAEATSNRGESRGWNVAIYARPCGGYVVTRERWTMWEGEESRDEAWTAATPEALLASLYSPSDTGGVLRPAELDAWERACREDERLAAIECEDLDEIGGGAEEVQS